MVQEPYVLNLHPYKRGKPCAEDLTQGGADAYGTKERVIVMTKELDISRRSFLGIGAAAAGVGALGMFGCTPSTPANNESADEQGQAEASELAPADSTEECDVVVVGMGTSGCVAASAAAREGAKVIGLDRANSMAGTNAANVSGVFAVGSTPELAEPNALTVEDMFKFIWEGTHYQSNAPALRNLLEASGKGMDLMIDAGVPFMYAFQGADENTALLNRGGHIYATSGEERATALQGMMDSFGVDSRWECEATNLLVEDGKVVGVRYTASDSSTVDIKAKNVIVATGGFMQNEEMLRKYYAGGLMYGPGNLYNDGAGINMAIAAGAQIGKNFSTSINESGACNMKSSVRFVSLTDCNETPVLSMPLFGGLFVNRMGDRFLDEGKMAKQTMYCGEPLLREGRYYAIVDQGFVDQLASNPARDFITDDAFTNMAPNVQMGFEGKTMSSLPDQLELGIEEGWVWRADTFEELAEAASLANLATTAEAYNGYCQNGHDDEMFKEAQFLRELAEGPFYAIELEAAAWVTLGGIKTDGHCRAVNADSQPIEGLFIAGVDGDFWAVPYFQGGSCQGFCVASGYLAGVTAAQA